MFEPIDTLASAQARLVIIDALVKQTDYRVDGLCCQPSEGDVNAVSSLITEIRKKTDEAISEIATALAEYDAGLKEKAV